jgi:uncharacterized protein (DUF1697 family)
MYVALLRGINVGGKNALPMKDLARIFERAGCKGVRTYIQSGNVIFDAPAGVSGFAESVKTQIEKQFGYKIPVMLRTSAKLRQIIRDNPFLAAGVPERTLYVSFLADLPAARAVTALDPGRSTPDAFCVPGPQIYLHLPKGVADSRLTNAYFDSKLSTISTARNWATVLKLAAMMAEG